MSGQPLKSYVILRRSDWPSEAALRSSAKASIAEAARMGDIRWVRSYVLEEPDGRIGTVCHYRASGPERIREHARRIGIPADDIVEVADLVVLEPDTPFELTAREREVLGLVAEGLRNRDIAGRLVCRCARSDHHVSAILRKLGHARAARRSSRRAGAD
ncbi:MAG TPA: nickel-binding protein [Gaiellaceae bacterium]|nr:nickel-binding protein [Gaiellaceae bacterium]